MPQVKVKLGKGINRDASPSELSPGFWSDCQNMRFRNGCDERVGGVAAVFTTPAVAPYALETFDVGTTSGTKRYLFQMGLAKAYVDDGTTQTEITRGLNGYISTITGAGAVVTVTTTANHGLTTGDNVIIGGVLPTGYNTDNSGAAITVTGVNTFTYANVTVAASTQVGYWDSDRTSNFTASAGEEITTCVLNGILYVNSFLDGTYYWGGSVATGAQRRLRRLRVGPTSSQGHVFGRAIRSYKDYLFVLGYKNLNNATTSGSTRAPYTIAWGSSAEPGSTPSTFTAASTNDAGSVQKTRGAVVDAKQFGETLYIYQERGIIAVDYINGNDVFNFRYLEGTDGLMAVNCIANSDKGQVFISQNKDVKVHAGGAPQSISEGRMTEWFTLNIDPTNQARSFLTINKKYDEVCICLPTTGNTNCNKAVTWNWAGDAWGERDLTNVTCGTSGMLPTTIALDERMVIASTTPTLGLVDSGTTYLGSTITSMVERTGMSFDNNSSVKNIQGTRWADDGTVGATSTISHGGGSMTPDTAPTYVTTTHTLGTTNWANAIATGGRFVAVKRSSTGAIGKCRTLEIDYSEGGDY